MSSRTGEKIGWTAGWMGGFIWVFLLSAVFLFQDKWDQGLLGIGLAGIAVVSIVYFSPWRFPSTPYWKLMIVPYIVFLFSVVWAICSYGGIKDIGLDWWNLLWLLPALIPFGILSHRKWAESEAQQSNPPNPRSMGR